MEAIADDPKELVLTLAGQGKGYVEITQQTGLNANTVRSWLHRAGLSQQKVVASGKAVVQRKDGPNEDHSSIVRNRLGKALVKATEALERIPTPGTQTAMRNLVALVKDVADPASKVFAWSESATHTAVDIRLLQSAQTIEAPAPVIDTTEVISDSKETKPPLDTAGAVTARE